MTTTGRRPLLAALAATAGLLAVTPPGAAAQTPPVISDRNPGVATRTVTPTDRRFAVKAAGGNMAEVVLGKLALERAGSDAVKQVAERLIKEHSAANAVLKPIAAQHKIALPKKLDPMHQAMYNRLSRLSGASFDKAYMAGQVKGHLNTITLFQMEIRQGKNPTLQDYALQNLPAIQDHTVMIVRVAEQVGVRPLPREARAYVGKSPAGNMKH